MRGIGRLLESLVQSAVCLQSQKRRKRGMFAMHLTFCLLGSVAASSVHAAIVNGQGYGLYGKLGLYHAVSMADGGSNTENGGWNATLGGNTYIGAPWLMRAQGAMTANLTTADTGTTRSRAHLNSAQLNLNLIPESILPMDVTASLTSSASDISQLAKSNELGKYLSNFNEAYKTYYVRGRTRLVLGNGGDQMGVWASSRKRGSNKNGNLTDLTMGEDIKLRFRGINVYQQVSMQRQEMSLTNGRSDNMVGSVMGNYVPSTQGYNKMLLNFSRVQNSTAESNGSYFSNSTTSWQQLSDMFFWRPKHRSFTVTGGLRVYNRDLSFLGADSSQTTLNGHMAVNRQINRKTNASISAQVSSLTLSSEKLGDASTNYQRDPVYNFDNNSISSTLPNLIVSYREDSRVVDILGGVITHWYADGGFNMGVGAEYQDIGEFSQKVNGGIGGNAQKSWNTGNRSVMRANFNVVGRALLNADSTLNVGTSDFNVEEYNLDFAAISTASLAWTESLRSASSYVQLSMMDSRYLEQSNETQLVNLQASRKMPLTRQSNWGGNISLQSSRRVSDRNSSDNFFTTSAARLSYQHNRFLGIYKLKFSTRADYAANLGAKPGGISDRQQVELESRLSYILGKLSMQGYVRKLYMNSGIGALFGMIQINRVF